MNSLVSLHHAVSGRLDRADWLLSTLARVVFAGALVMYFWVSGLTKLGDGLAGLINPSVGAYVQMFPRVMESVGYDSSQLGVIYRLIAIAGTWAEFILPALIVVGLLTRLAALGMIGFVAVQSLTDYYGHGQVAELGAWFDRFPNAPILDQRAFWTFVLLVLVIKGAGPLSFDRALSRSRLSA
ncbi:DoxX family protein [Sulfitobacter sabulilitoris]|uniref:DoxX family protein n=1 Tax=Sulfitobacter sabulilitoris TaxID=2562655 RepID=A0A5S3PB91_9RHOB|nr:DoxX family protein [Sulfitobacter sabulilitoris]TMM50868.1 DoxX family protein [Sulfitobacter sabulilitoris]